MADLTFGDISKLIKADFDAGKLTWLPRTPSMFPNDKGEAEKHCKWWNTRYAWKSALAAQDGNGYSKGFIHGERYYCHRVMWLLAYGKWPSEEIDHINGNRSDNRLVNLREVSTGENSKNRSISRNNKSGVQGVSWHKFSGKWAAQINTGGKRINLGYFDNFEDAVSVRRAAEVEYGFHPNHGRAA